MALDGGFSGLLCVEDNTSVFFDENEESGSVHSSNAMLQNRYSGSDGVWPPVSEDGLVKLLGKEHHHMPNVEYVNRLRNGDLASCGRNEAIDWIKKVHTHFGFGPLCAYLSVNYLDRFLSAYDLPKGIAWMTQLLAVACLSLAAKMEEIFVPSSLDLQVGELKYIFEARTVKRMELLVLSKLSWRMQAVTPFSFLDNFLNTQLDTVSLPPKAAIQRSIEIISIMIGDIDFLEFKPSEIAAAVAMYAHGDTKKPILSSLSQHVDKYTVVRCLELIHGLVSTKPTTVSASLIPRSPIGVLDMSCFSYKSDDETTNPSCSFSSQNSNASGSKRRKIQRKSEG